MNRIIFYILIGVILLVNGCGSAKPLTYQQLRAGFNIDKSKTKAPRNKDGQLHGVYETYNKMGKLSYTCTYVNGKKHGMARAYGNESYDRLIYNLQEAQGRVPKSAADLDYYKMGEVNYVNGKREGYALYFNFEGTVHGKTFYRNGVDIEHQAQGKEISREMSKLDKKLAACREEVRRGEHDFTRCTYIQSAIKNLSADAYQLGH